MIGRYFNIAPGWLLMIFIVGSGGATVQTVGTFATSEQCEQALKGFNELVDYSNKSPLPSNSSNPLNSKSYSKCILIGNPVIFVEAK